MNSIKKILKIFVFLLIALPILGFLALGKLFFKQNDVAKNSLFINKANADAPSSLCGGTCGNSGSTGSSCGASQCDGTCGGCGRSNNNGPSGGGGDGGDGGGGGGGGGK